MINCTRPISRNVPDGALTGLARCARCQQLRKPYCHPSMPIPKSGHGRYIGPQPACQACRVAKKGCSFGARARSGQHSSGSVHCNHYTSAQSATMAPRPAVDTTAVTTTFTERPGNTGGTLETTMLRRKTSSTTLLHGGTRKPPAAIPTSARSWPDEADQRVMGQHAWRDFGWG